MELSKVPSSNLPQEEKWHFRASLQKHKRREHYNSIDHILLAWLERTKFKYVTAKSGRSRVYCVHSIDPGLDNAIWEELLNKSSPFVSIEKLDIECKQHRNKIKK